MQGFNDLVKNCWSIQAEYNLSNIEMLQLINKLKKHYEKRNEINQEYEREHIRNLINATFQTIKDNS